MNLTRTVPVAAVGLALSVTSLGSAQAAAPTERATAPAYVVSATVSRDAVVQGGRIVLRGTVRKAGRGERVRVQVRYAGAGWTWSDLSDRLDSRGRFRIAETVDGTRTRAYRVVKPAGDGRRAGRSKPLRVQVYSWRDLTSLAVVSSRSTHEVKRLKMNAVAFENSIEATHYSNSGAISYNVERKCRRLETRVGLSDDSQETATGTAVLRADGVARFTRSYQLTQYSRASVALTGVFRLTLDWTSSNTAGTPEDQSGAVVALGSPQILCRD